MKRTILLSLLFVFSLSTPAKVVDDFNDNTKTGWSDFTFIPGFGIPTETEGQLRFIQPPSPTEDGIFSATQKTSEAFELKEGRTIEIKVDVVESGGKDSFAVLSWLPVNIGGNPNSPGTLSGYGLSKSRTDVLVSKGINRYFAAEGWPPSGLPDAPSENITLVLTLTASNGNVIINGKVLDKANNNAVLWDKTYIDTPNADVVFPEADSPKEPFVTSGYVTLYLYQDFDDGAIEDPYYVYYDNLEVKVRETVTLDDFNDNTKSGWTDFTFIPGFGIPTESSEQFRFEQPPSPTGDGIFSASQKTSRAFDLTEGEELELRVDVIETGAKDSFAILGWIPVSIGGNPNSPGTLSGYGLAKSRTDVLVTKGINRYFAADGWPPSGLPDAPSENITLVLNLSASGGKVMINGKVLDKANNNAVLWSKTFTDTVDVDLVFPESDSPKEPFINTSGYFTLYLYQDFDDGAPENPYYVYYDNAVVVSPPVAANTAPIIIDAVPAEGFNFVPAADAVSFKVTDDKALGDDKISLSLNGTKYTTANGLVLSGTPTARIVTLPGKLQPNVNYTAMAEVEDSEGVDATHSIYFDTFLHSNFLIEAEDYNFAGNYINDPILTAEDPAWFDPVDANSYRNQVGTDGIDYDDTRTAVDLDDAPYRKSDFVRMARSIDNARPDYVGAGGSDAFIFDYDVGDIAAGEWLNFTRNFPAGSYEVYLRESVVNLAGAEATLEQVTSDRTLENQTTTVLGSFLAPRTGYTFRSIPLTDGTGANKVVLRLSGETTLRLRQNTTDAEGTGIRQNYLVFVPVPDAGVQRATIASLSPSPGSTTETFAPAIRVEIRNRDTTVKTETIQLQLNGQTVSGVVTPDANGAVVTFNISELPASGALNTARITFKDSQDVDVSAEWSFRISYKSLNAANRSSGTPGERGFNIRLVQKPSDQPNLENSIGRAEDQLAPNSTIPKAIDTTGITPVVNFEQDGLPAGQFQEGDIIPPGLKPEENGTDDFAVELTAWLDLAAGVHRFGVTSDDGYKVSSGAGLSDSTASPLRFHSDGTANDETFEFLVTQAGLYPFRMVWYERGGGAHAEFYSINRETGERTLINDPSNANAIKAYVSVTATDTIEVFSTTDLGTAFQPVATVPGNTNPIIIPAAGDIRFYRLRRSGSLGQGESFRIGSISKNGANVEISHQIQAPPP